MKNDIIPRKVGNSLKFINTAKNNKEKDENENVVDCHLNYNGSYPPRVFNIFVIITCEIGYMNTCKGFRRKDVKKRKKYKLFPMVGQLEVWTLKYFTCNKC